MSELLTVVEQRDTFERRRIDCPVCAEGELLEPRSSDKWGCGTCSRLFTEAELAEMGVDDV